MNDFEIVPRPSPECSVVSEAAPPGDPAPPPPRPTFAQVYREGAAVVRRTLRLFGVAERDCEDAMHEVFVVVLRRLPDDDPRRPLQAWLRGIARFIALRHGAKQRRTVLLEDMPGMEQEAAKMAGEAQLDQERRTILQQLFLRLLDSLAPERRDVFVMHELEDMTIPEIAAELGIPAGTATTRLRLAREDMKAALERLKASQRGGGALGALTLALMLEVEREIPPLPPGMAARVLARLQGAAGAPGPGSGPGSGPESDAVAGVVKQGATLLARGAAGPLLLAAGIALGTLWHPREAPASPPSAAPSASVVPAAAETPSPPPSVSVATNAELAPDAGPLSRAADDEAEETSLLRKASSALAAGDPAAALAAVDEHARRFHGGRHVEEREGYRILALVRAGRRAEARDRVQRFARIYPASRRLDALRGLTDEGTVPP